MKKITSSQLKQGQRQGLGLGILGEPTLPERDYPYECGQLSQTIQGIIPYLNDLERELVNVYREAQTNPQEGAYEESYFVRRYKAIINAIRDEIKSSAK